MHDISNLTVAPFNSLQHLQLLRTPNECYAKLAASLSHVLTPTWETQAWSAAWLERLGHNADSSFDILIRVGMRSGVPFETDLLTLQGLYTLRDSRFGCQIGGLRRIYKTAKRGLLPVK
jgi:hypothetical protein